jgi:hypothetical protein
VNGAFGNALAILMGELLEQLIILHQHRTAGTGGDRVLVICDGIAASGCERRFVSHVTPPSVLHSI